MAMVPTAFINTGMLDQAVQRAKAKLGSDVVKIGYAIGADSTGDTSIFFRILLSDAASQESTIGEATSRISAILFDEIQPYDNWGVLPYFSFRSASEQSRHPEAAWE